jgi:hypothetical protein
LIPTSSVGIAFQAMNFINFDLPVWYSLTYFKLSILKLLKYPWSRVFQKGSKNILHNKIGLVSKKLWPDEVSEFLSNNL